MSEVVTPKVVVRFKHPTLTCAQLDELAVDGSGRHMNRKCGDPQTFEVGFEFSDDYETLSKRIESVTSIKPMRLSGRSVFPNDPLVRHYLGKRA